jgi:hypothetical protein
MVLQAGKLGGHIGWQQVRAGGQHLPKFDKHSARLLERLTNVARERPSLRSRRPSPGQVRRESMAREDAANGDVTPASAKSLPHRSQWMRDRAVPQSILHRGEPSRLGQQVHQHGDQHRGDQRSEKDGEPLQVMRTVRAAPGDCPHRDDPDDQAQPTCDECAPPAKCDAEESPAHPCEDHYDHECQQTAEDRNAPQALRAANRHRHSVPGRCPQ